MRNIMRCPEPDGVFLLYNAPNVLLKVHPPVNPAVVHPKLCATKHHGTDITSGITPGRSCKTGSCQGCRQGTMIS